MDQQKIGGFIAALRKEKGLTQRQLADRLYVTNKAVSKWELGRSLPDSATLEPLARALGVTVDELLAGEKRPEGAPVPEKPKVSQFALYQNYVQGYVQGAEVERRRCLGLVLLWAGILLLLGQCIYLVNHSYTRFLNVDALNALTEEQMAAVTQTTVFPGVTLMQGAHGTAVMLTWLWGWALWGWPGTALVLLSAALIAAGAVVRHRAKKQMGPQAKNT